MQRVERVEMRQQQPVHQRVGRGQADRAAQRGVGARELALGGLHLFAQAAELLAQALARRRERVAALLAVEQAHAERALERAEAPQDRRVIHLELARGARDRARLGDDEKVVQVGPVHGLLVARS